MSINSSINVEVSPSEAENLISGMSECRYKDVYQLIDKLRQYVKKGSSVGSVNVAMSLDMARMSLTAIVKKPFCEVYELVGKINEKLQEANSKTTKVEGEIDSAVIKTSDISSANKNETLDKSSLINRVSELDDVVIKEKSSANSDTVVSSREWLLGGAEGALHSASLEGSAGDLPKEISGGMMRSENIG